MLPRRLVMAQPKLFCKDDFYSLQKEANSRQLANPSVVALNATLFVFFKSEVEGTLISSAKQTHFCTAVGAIAGLWTLKVENILATARTVLGVFEVIIA